MDMHPYPKQNSNQGVIQDGATGNCVLCRLFLLSEEVSFLRHFFFSGKKGLSAVATRFIVLYHDAHRRTEEPRNSLLRTADFWFKSGDCPWSHTFQGNLYDTWLWSDRLNLANVWMCILVLNAGCKAGGCKKGGRKLSSADRGQTPVELPVS